MKRVLMIIGIFFGSLVLAAELALIGLVMKPELFGISGVAQPEKQVSPQHLSKVDSSVTAAVTEPDSRERRDTSVAQKTQLSPPPSPVDTVQSLHVAFQKEQPVIEHVNETERRGLVREDSIRAVNLQVLAKMMDSMEAADAARILKKLSDSEARNVLMKVKRRQAGKILSVLDPDRAANMMR